MPLLCLLMLIHGGNGIQHVIGYLHVILPKGSRVYLRGVCSAGSKESVMRLLLLRWQSAYCLGNSSSNNVNVTF